MSTLLRNALIAGAMTIGFSAATQAAAVAEVPSVSQDPVIQHLKLTNDQVTKIKALHQALETNVQNIKITGFEDGALVDVIQSGKWNDAVVKKQLAAFSQLDEQARYYRVKYYFGVNQVLTPAQREQIKKDLIQAID